MSKVEPVVDKKKFKSAIEKYGGSTRAIAKGLHVCRTTVYAYLKRWPDLKDYLKEVRETINPELADDGVTHNLREGNWATIKWYKAVYEGLIERKELTGKDGGPIDVAGQLTIQDRSALREFGRRLGKVKSEGPEGSDSGDNG